MDNYLHYDFLRKKVLEIAGIKSISAADCKMLAILLSKKKDYYISETTLKRIYGFARTKFGASVYTKDVMASFCGYNSWSDYLSKVNLNGYVADCDPSGRIILPEEDTLLKPFLDAVPVRISILQAVYDETGAIQDFRIKLVNKELEKITGRKDLLGKLYGEEYPGIKLTGLYELMLKVMETGQPERIDYFYAHEGFNQWFSSTFVKTAVGLLATNCDLPDAA